MRDSTGVAGGIEDGQNNAGAYTQPAGANTLPDSVSEVLRLLNANHKNEVTKCQAQK